MSPYEENPERITYFAQTDARGKNARFGIKAKDRSKHMYVIGKTGMGKSTLLENMAIQDIQNGEGLAFIDPHGSTAEKLLDYIPEERMKDVLYFAPFDMEYPVAFNVMEDVGYDKRHLVVSGLMSAFKKIWVDAWSGRMEYILSNTLLALLEYPDSTLLDVNRMYTNKTFRKKVVDNIKDPLVRAFWVDEFAMYTDRYTQEATPAIQNKVGQFTSNPIIRNIIGQPKSTFDLREMMDNKKIFIANLSKGRVGETNADLLGSMLTTKIYLAAMSRADLSAQQMLKLPNSYFYVDEFQSIANDSFADILSEARKYKLNLIIAHQYIEQMEENVRNAVFGNVGTTVTFRVGPFDAEVLETVFSPKFLAEDLVNLSFAQIYLTLMIDGVGSRPFSATTLPPIEPPRLSYRDQIMASSREKFARPRDIVEKEVAERTQTVSGEVQGDEKGMKESMAKKSATSSGYKKPLPRSEPKAEVRVEKKIEQREEKKVNQNVDQRSEKPRDSQRSRERPPVRERAPVAQSSDGVVARSLQTILAETQKSTPKSAHKNISAPKPVDSGAHLKELRSTLATIAKSGQNKVEISKNQDRNQDKNPDKNSAKVNNPIKERQQEKDPSKVKPVSAPSRPQAEKAKTSEVGSPLSTGTPGKPDQPVGGLGGETPSAETSSKESIPQKQTKEIPEKVLRDILDSKEE